jgi:predicted nucleic acid-binding protein
VVDASVMVEALIGSRHWQDELGRWQDEGALILAPPHFRLETVNALLRGVRLEPTDVMARVGALFAAGVDVADRGLGGVFEALELAHRHGLTVYDAAYLQLVLEVDGELATLDRALAGAARTEGVPVIV